MSPILEQSVEIERLLQKNGLGYLGKCSVTGGLQVFHFSWLGRSCDRLPASALICLSESMPSSRNPLSPSPGRRCIDQLLFFLQSQSELVLIQWRAGVRRPLALLWGRSFHLAVCCNHDSGIAMWEYCNLQFRVHTVFYQKVMFILSKNEIN